MQKQAWQASSLLLFCSPSPAPALLLPGALCRKPFGPFSGAAPVGMEKSSGRVQRRAVLTQWSKGQEAAPRRTASSAGLTRPTLLGESASTGRAALLLATGNRRVVVDKVLRAFVQRPLLLCKGPLNGPCRISSLRAKQSSAWGLLELCSGKSLKAQARVCRAAAAFHSCSLLRLPQHSPET